MFLKEEKYSNKMFKLLASSVKESNILLRKGKKNLLIIVVAVVIEVIVEVAVVFWKN